MIDLHTHTSYSDGDYSPSDLVELAFKKGVKVISITDHDTVGAFKSNIIKLAGDYGMLLIPGIEFSTIDEVSGQKIHVVGLNIDVNDVNLNSICDQLYDSRLNYLHRVDKKLADLGIKLRSHNIINSASTITKSHISRDVITNPANENILIAKYGFVPMYSVFIGDYLAKGKPAFVKDDTEFHTKSAVDVIKQAGGKAICAHPSFNVLRGFSFDSMQQLILRNGFDGIETVNIQYDKKSNDSRFDMVAEFTEFAENNRLLSSGGSDFHGDNKIIYGEHSDLGLTNELYDISMKQLERIMQ